MGAFSTGSETVVMMDGERKGGLGSDDLVQTINALPIEQRTAFVSRWAHDVEDGSFFCENDPVADVIALQRVLLGILSTAQQMGVSPGLVAWVDPMEDPLGALRQAQTVAGLLLSYPAFVDATGCSVLTRH